MASETRAVQSPTATRLTALTGSEPSPRGAGPPPPPTSPRYRASLRWPRRCVRPARGSMRGPTCRRHVCDHGFLAGSLLTSRTLLHLISALRCRYRHSLFAHLPLHYLHSSTSTHLERSRRGREKKESNQSLQPGCKLRNL
jgi:hypothetical protein